MRVEVISFGFKNGIPLNANFVFDVRGMHNPHKNPHMRRLTGLDAAVQHDVFSKVDGEFMFNTIAIALWGFMKGETRDLRVAIGCIGGRHRSVAMVERLAAMLRDKFTPPLDQVLVTHRELKL
jgi:UPF0042 nucleotide-binding protein